MDPSKEKNPTQREPAARLDVTDKAVSRWETGDSQRERNHNKPTPVPLVQPLGDKQDRRLLALACGVLALGLLFPVLDRFLNPQAPSAVLRLLGAVAALAGGLAVLWANIRRLRTDQRQVEQCNWSAFLAVMIVALLSAALGIFLLVLALH